MVSSVPYLTSVAAISVSCPAPVCNLIARSFTKTVFSLHIFLYIKIACLSRDRPKSVHPAPSLTITKINFCPFFSIYRFSCNSAQGTLPDTFPAFFFPPGSLKSLILSISLLFTVTTVSKSPFCTRVLDESPCSAF